MILVLIPDKYVQYYNGLFRIPFMGRWTVVLSGDLIEEYARAPDSILSFQEVLNQVGFAFVYMIRV